jgi:hypothetical protein
VSADLERLARLAAIDPRPEESDELRRRLQALQALIDALPDEVDEAGHLLPTDLVLRVDEPGPALDRSLVDRLGDGLVDLPPVREDGS